MHEHLGLQLAGSSNAPPTPPATQGSSQSGSGSSSRPSAAGPQSSGSSGPSAPRSSAQSRTGNSHVPAQQQPSQTPQHPAPQQQNQQQVAQQQVAHPPPQVQGQPQVAPADEIAALKARITELERGDAHGNHIPARAGPPHQALIADPAAIDRVRANLAIAKDEPKKLALPALRPGHKVSALSLRKSTVCFVYYRITSSFVFISVSLWDSALANFCLHTALHHIVIRVPPLRRILTVIFLLAVTVHSSLLIYRTL